ncbi:hypothetical protein NDU88_005516 [Pleurodeles waltl]|uniref:Uncharacterized protein n=1 Tax=Pleurodeles waltl TaxID=8319 RepID=A0AAV7RMB9_PLEWA|nr:hypothetical protein NDU88_005516 [Pleurodeles waltl]
MDRCGPWRWPARREQWLQTMPWITQWERWKQRSRKAASNHPVGQRGGLRLLAGKGPHMQQAVPHVASRPV